MHSGYLNHVKTTINNLQKRETSMEIVDKAVQTVFIGKER